jgi:hypothetical protein
VLDADKLIRSLSVLSDYHLFIDDIQQVVLDPYSSDDVSPLLDRLTELSAHHTVWVVCDVVQCWLGVVVSNISKYRVILEKLSDRQQVSLSLNLRNTRDIADILCVIRDMYIEYYNDRIGVLDMILPKQIPGHFIHGPKVIFHVLNSKNQITSEFLNIELDKLTSANDILNNSNVSVVYNYYDDVSSLVKDTVNTRCSDTTGKIAVCHSQVTYSTEWPAVVVLFGVHRGFDESFLRVLYLALSRARVYCSVVLYLAEEGDTLDNNRFVSRLLDRLKDRVQVIRH